LTVKRFRYKNSRTAPSPVLKRKRRSGEGVYRGEKVDNQNGNGKIEEIQWCDHMKVDPVRIIGYAVVHIASVGCVLIVGQGKVRVVCERCTPDLLAKIQAIR
jgi:hypothetical protein